MSVPGELEAVFEAITRQWGRLDILVHSIAFAPKEDLQGGLLNCSAEGFAKAMDVSCHSFVRMARLAAPLMTNGGTMFAMSYHGANKVDSHVQRDGSGEGRARSVLPLPRLRAGRQRASACTRSRPGRSRRARRPASRTSTCCSTEAAQRAPIGELVDIMDVGFTCAYLATPYARRLSGETLYVDGGVNIMA